jgi:hypothetical protein
MPESSGPPPDAGAPRPSRLDPSLIDDLARRTRKFLLELARDYVKRPVDELLGFILGRALAYLLAAALFITAAVFLLVGGVEGLKAAGVPPWISHLALGVVGLLGGLVALYAGRTRKSQS